MAASFHLFSGWEEGEECCLPASRRTFHGQIQMSSLSRYCFKSSSMTFGTASLPS